jgi:hypothetical protein
VLDLPNHSTNCSETSGIAGLPPGQPLPQRNRPETLTIKRNRRNRLFRSRNRPTRKTTKSSPIQERFGGKVTSQRGTRSSYVTPTKTQEIVLKTPPKKSLENPRSLQNFFITRMPGDRNLLSLDANLAIPMRVLRFEASRRQRPGQSDRPPGRLDRPGQSERPMRSDRPS